jgi:Raf kinase inhibitor-like YbhB/YbcL family protein
MAIHVASPAFSEGGQIPRRYTCDGEDISPPLSWSGVPEGAKSLALICDDPDAPGKTWVHWVLFSVPARETLPGGGAQGTNDFRKIGYGGPCPPGGTHRYMFRLSALDADVALAPGATRADLDRAMKGRVLAEGILTGKYSRA